MAYLDETGVQELTADIKTLTDQAYFHVYKKSFIGNSGVPTESEIIQSISYGDDADSFIVDFVNNDDNSCFLIMWQKRTPTNANGIGFGYYQTINNDNTIYKYLYANNELKIINYFNIINSNLAEIENSGTASRAYVTGELLVSNTNLCRVISPISKGEAFVLNNNVVYADLSTIDESGANYSRLVDGTLIQWGESYIEQGVYVQTAWVLFAKPFINTNYIVMISPADSITIGTPSSGNKTTTGFRCGRSPNTATNYYSWLAIGRWK